ncbi:MAG: SLC13 family permease [Planctomycetota bacterium]|jgi:sodium-dependent dicarboxylate transporter 2/3/5
MGKTLSNVTVGLVALLVLTSGPSGLADGLAMPEPARVSLAIMLLAAVLWISEAVPLFVTSLVILALSLTWLEGSMLDSGMEVSGAVFTGAFFSDIILLFLGGFVLSLALHKMQIDRTLAHWVIARTGGSGPRLLLGIVCITAFLSMWLSNTATAAMMLGLCLPILQALPPEDRFRKALVLAIPFSANVGGIGTPIGTPPNAIAIQYLQEVGRAPSFAEWMGLAIPIVVVMLGVTWGLLLVLFRGDGRRLTLPAAPPRPPLSPKLVTVVAVTLVTAAGWLTTTIHGLSAGTVALLPVIVLFGARILTVQDLRQLPWDVLLLMGGGLCLGKGIAVSGLAAWLIERVPVAGLEFPVLVMLFAVVACFMSSVMSNTATANLLMPIIAGMTAIAVSPLLVAVAVACSMAMALPVSTPPNALAFASGETAVKDMIRSGVAVTVIGLVVLATTGFWWWRVIGLL